MIVFNQIANKYVCIDGYLGASLLQPRQPDSGDLTPLGAAKRFIIGFRGTEFPRII